MKKNGMCLEQKLYQKQTHRLMMLPKMQQAIHLLQLPVLELKAFVELEIEQNPCVERFEEESKREKESGDISFEKELDFSRQNFQAIADWEAEHGFDDAFKEQDEIAALTTSAGLFEHLMLQAKEAFQSEDDLAIAEFIVGNLDESGLLTLPLEEIAIDAKTTKDSLENILNIVQSFSPPGVGARSMQENFLIQLKEKKREESLAYKMISLHFADLLQNNIEKISRHLKASPKEIKQAIKEDLSLLCFHPGKAMTSEKAQHVVPDIILKHRDRSFQIIINTEDLPKITFSKTYLSLLQSESTSKETKEFIQEKFDSARWLMKNIQQRNKQLKDITLALVKRNRAFFDGEKGRLAPLTMEELSLELGVHESTVARAVADKYLCCFHGTFPLRSFFNKGFTKEGSAPVSSRTIETLLEEMIQNEDKASPLSDASLAEKLKTQGIICARRTIAKYRQAKKLGNASQRKQL